ncbi:hypothetical protein AMTRI_Chr08g202410 [Amborella trichopoda]
MAVARPSRSDEHLPREAELKMEEEIKHYFEDMAPKRHTKPQRSEYSSEYRDQIGIGGESEVIAEHERFRLLETDDEQKLVYDVKEAGEEYVETEYYKDLNCVDKQHHTTGTGFIKMEKSSTNSFNLLPETNGNECHASCRGNPATNEWIPAADPVFLASDKPKRSES